APGGGSMPEMGGASGGSMPDMSSAPGGFMPQAGGSSTADDGKFKVMTVDGVETPIKAGTYKGKVVIEELDGTKKAYYENGQNVYQGALFIENNAIVTEKSAKSALVGGKYDAKSLSGVSITAKSPYFNGITLIDQDYSISNLTADLSGDGGNDMSGTGSVIAVFKGSNVTISKSAITTHGTARAGVFGGSDDINNPAHITIKDTTIIANGHNTVEPTSVWMLGLFGDVRAVQYVGYFENVYDNVTIKSAGWAIVSVDDVDPPTQDSLKKAGIISAYNEKTGYGSRTADDILKLYYWSGRHTIKNSDLSILSIKDGGWSDGYGAYSIGANLNIFDNTKVSNVTYGGILANEYASVSYVNGAVVNSNRFGVYSHSNKGGIINVDNSTMNTKEAIFLLKSASGGFGPNATMVDVNGSKLNNTGNGVVLLLMDNDDPGRGNPLYGEDGKTQIDQKIDLVDNVAVKDETHDLTKEYDYQTSQFMGADASYMFNTNVVATFTDCNGDKAIKGDFYNARTGGQNLVLHFNNCNVDGIISSGTTKHDVNIILKSMKITDKDYEKDGVRYGNRNNLGDVTTSPSKTVNNGVIAYLENGTTWTVKDTSYISKLIVSKDSKVEGRIKADGKTTSADGSVTYLGVVAEKE
ncbi:MAG: hypothetical protein JW944_15015, partial [Deltaproteobacteria bacterium]|nr:hypothetical protein [Deltaproteobacteria bacterium]